MFFVHFFIFLQPEFKQLTKPIALKVSNIK